MVFLFVDFYNGCENGVYIDNFVEVFWVYNCMDYLVEDDLVVEVVMDVKIVVGVLMIVLYWSGLDFCEVWLYLFMGMCEEIYVEGVGLILVVGMINDFVILYEWLELFVD